MRAEFEPRMLDYKYLPRNGDILKDSGNKRKEFIFGVNRIRDLMELEGKIEIGSEHQDGAQEIPGYSLHQVASLPVPHAPSNVLWKSVLRTPRCRELGVGDEDRLLNF